MAGNLPVPLGLETKLVWTWNGNAHALNIIHWRNTSSAAITQTLANTIDSAAKTAFTGSGLPAMMPTGFALQSVHSRSMIANTDPWYIGAGTPVPGTSASNPLPAATSFCVTLRTGQRGRSYNGRVYFTGYSEDSNDALGGATEATRTNSVGFLNLWFAALSSGSPPFTLCVLSRFTTPPGGTSPVERPTPLLTAVTSIIGMDLRWDTQRRRATPGV